MIYAEAVRMVRGMTNRKTPKVGNTTDAEIEYDNSVSIRLHGTAVVRFYPNGLVKLNSGGWRTSTTKDRINKYSPVKVLLNEFRDYPPMTRVVPLQWKECLEMVKSYQEEKSIEFDVVILTRFDIVFNNLFSEYNIDFEKVNMECIFVPDFMSGDNFILIPKAFFNVSVNVVQNLVDNKINSHETWKHFEQRNVPCHYIGGETSLRGCDYNIMFRLTRCLYPPYQWK
jgi:hypothetical protein